MADSDKLFVTAASSQATDHAANRARFDATVLVNRVLCREHFLLRLRVTGPGVFPATAPGQFVQLGCRSPEALSSDALLGNEIAWDEGQWPTLNQPELCSPLAMLRRPFSLAGRGEDEQGTWIEVVHRVVGIGTSWLAKLNVGDDVDLIGPLGNRFALPADRSHGLLVGGGVGLPPMFYLARALRTANWSATAFVGAMTSDLLAVTFDDAITPSTDGSPTLSVREFSEQNIASVVTTDDGSKGLQGRITRGLKQSLESLSTEQRSKTVIFTCGPDVMMHAVAQLASEFGVDCQVCVEQAMACGMGTCQSCVVKIEDRDKPQASTADGRPWRYRLACTDGPVFSSKSVVW